MYEKVHFAKCTVVMTQKKKKSIEAGLRYVAILYQAILFLISIIGMKLKKLKVKKKFNNFEKVKMMWEELYDAIASWMIRISIRSGLTRNRGLVALLYCSTTVLDLDEKFVLIFFFLEMAPWLVNLLFFNKNIEH